MDVCREVGAQAIVKGLRGDTDFAYELPMALMNRHLTGVETVFLPGDPEFAHVSSSLVKEVAALGGDVEGLVPDAVLEALLARVRPAPEAEPPVRSTAADRPAFGRRGDPPVISGVGLRPRDAGRVPLGTHTVSGAMNRLDPRLPLVFDIKDLGRRPGAMVKRTADGRGA